jgi:tRNA pseudouridine13 synthase
MFFEKRKNHKVSDYANIMKLKSTPEDFIVEEINDSLKISEKKDNFRLYVLEKKSIETFALISLLSKKFRIPYGNFGIAGIKDKHALTKQYLTIPVKFEIPKIDERNFSLKPAGFVQRKLHPGDLDRNRFAIVARDIKLGELDGIKKKFNEVKEFGVPNYFDSQRFGSVMYDAEKKELQFAAKYILKKDYETALKSVLAFYSKSESKKIKDQKRFISLNWEKIIRRKINQKEIDSNISYPFFRKILDEIQKKDFHSAYLLIPDNLREMYVSAYQSFLWNECVKELLKIKIDKKNLTEIEYNIGKLIYFKNISHEQFKKIQEVFPTISSELNPEKISADEKKIIEEILCSEKISLSDFSIKKETGNFFKSQKRDVIAIPENPMLEINFDELNNNERRRVYKAKISFILKKGSYATAITKKIFNQ